MGKLGLGDLIPMSLLGKVLVVTIILIGTIFIKFGFVIIINLLDLSSHEKLALSLIQTLGYSNEARDSAAKIMTYLFQINSLRNHLDSSQPPPRRLQHIIHHLRVEVLNFQRLKQ